MIPEQQFKDLLGRPIKTGDYITFPDSWNVHTEWLLIGKVKAIERTAKKITLNVETYYTGQNAYDPVRSTKLAKPGSARLQFNTSSSHCRILILDETTLKTLNI